MFEVLQLAKKRKEKKEERNFSLYVTLQQEVAIFSTLIRAITASLCLVVFSHFAAFFLIIGIVFSGAHPPW